MSDATAMTPWFTQRRRVEPDDVDAQAHVNNVVYVAWVQDVAVAHWEALASAELLRTIWWVASRHEIDYLAPALRDDEVEVRTRVGHAEGLRFERFTEIHRIGDARLLVRSRTIWVPVDPRTGRPARIGPEVRALVSSD